MEDQRLREAEGENVGRPPVFFAIFDSCSFREAELPNQNTKVQLQIQHSP